MTSRTHRCVISLVDNILTWGLTGIVCSLRVSVIAPSSPTSVNIDTQLICFLLGALFGSPAADDGDGSWESLDFHQQVFMLSGFSNVIRAERKTLRELQASALVNVTIPVRTVGWQVVWGPVVWKSDPDNESGPDHVWFVAKKLTHGDEDIYVISVAGSATIYNTLVNNAGVIPVVNFTTWAPDAPPTPSLIPTSSMAPYISLGTAMGVHTLESYPAPAGAAGAGQTLPVFLKNAPRGSSSQFIFTGLSLGGTLTSTLALRLVKPDADIFPDTVSVLTYPIACVSPGNVHFANAFAARFPKLLGPGYKVWNGNIANLLDVATNAWSTDDNQPLYLDRIRRIYGNEPITGIESGIDLAKIAADKSGMVYIPLQSTIFRSSIPFNPPTNELEFIGIAALQHSVAYEAFFGVRLSGAGGVKESLFPDVVIGIV